MIIKIKNLTIETIVGIYAFEQNKKQRLIINAEIDYDEGNSSLSDNINEGMNYHPICDGITKLVSENKYHIIEHVCHKVGQYILSYDKVKSAKVEIDKPDAPIEGIESISVSGFFNK